MHRVSLVAAATVAALTALGAAACGSSKHAAPRHPPAPHSDFAGSELASVTPAPPLALHEPDGTRVTLAQQRGRYALVTFLYTRCPDVCPLIASNLNTALGALGPRRADVRVLAVSVDPRNDTPASVRAYRRTHRLRPEFRYLIGTRPELVRVWRAYHVLAVARKADRVDHVAYTALIDRDGRERVIYDSDVQARAVTHDVRVLMRRDAG